MEERIKRYFRKGYKYLEIILFLDKRQHMQLSKWSFQRYVNRVELLEKNFHTGSIRRYPTIFRSKQIKSLIQ